MIVVVMALVPLGLWVAMLPDMVLGWWRTFVEENIGEFWGKPLALCSRCMVTLYGTGAALALGWEFDLLHWLVYVPMAVGLQELLHRPE